MRSRLLSFSLIFCFIIPAGAIDENFYMVHRNDPQKLIPSTLRCALKIGDECRVFVDPYPQDATISEITWSASSDIVEISPSASSCTLRAISSGICSLIARDASGAECEIQLSVSSSAPSTLQLIGPTQTVSAGETVLIHAQSDQPDAEIIWQVQDGGYASVSYGGSTCKINTHSAGRIYVRAYISNSNVSSDYILDVHRSSIAPNLFANLPRTLLIFAVFLLVLSFILWISTRRRHLFD